MRDGLARQTHDPRVAFGIHKRLPVGHEVSPIRIEPSGMPSLIPTGRSLSMSRRWRGFAGASLSPIGLEYLKRLNLSELRKINSPTVPLDCSSYSVTGDTDTQVCNTKAAAHLQSQKVVDGRVSRTDALARPRWRHVTLRVGRQ